MIQHYLPNDRKFTWGMKLNQWFATITKDQCRKQMMQQANVKAILYNKPFLAGNAFSQW